MAIFISGSVAFDYLMTFPGYFRENILPDKLDKISLSFLVDSMTRQRGGCAPNIAYSMALLGEKPSVIATSGEDFAEYRQWMESNGIDARYIHDIPQKYTASFFVNTDLENNQIASFYTGAMADAAQFSLYEIPAGEIDYLVISPNDPLAMRKFTDEAVQLGIPYLFDPSQQVARNPHEDLRVGVEHAHAVFCNEYEFDLLVKHTGFSAEEIDRHVRLMVITRGEKGATIKSDEQKYHIPIDSTGKGRRSHWCGRRVQGWFPAWISPWAGPANLRSNGCAFRHLLPRTERNEQLQLHPARIHRSLPPAF